MSDCRLDLDAYAALAVELADPATDRSALLRRNGLDEATWEAVEEAWHSRLSDADSQEASEAVPPFVVAYAEAFSRAQNQRSRARRAAVLSFESFVEIARAMRRGRDLANLLSRMNVRFEDYLSAQQHWTARMMEDSELAARFVESMR